MGRATVCVTFDNMGNAAAVGEGTTTAADPGEPGLAVGYPRVLDLLDRLGLRATFFVEGWNGIHHPERVAELADRGHEVGLHGWVHEQWGRLGAVEVDDLLRRGDDALRATGVEPVGFRSPGGSRGPHTAARLAGLGYRLDASLADDGEPEVPHRLPEGIAQVPFRWEAVDGFYYLAGHDDPVGAYEAGVGALLDAAVESSGYVTLIHHAFISAVDDDRFSALTRTLERVAGDASIDACTAGEVADSVLAGNSAG